MNRKALSLAKRGKAHVVGPSSESIQRKAEEFKRYYGCVQERGKRHKALVPRLMDHFNVSRSTIMRALAGRPRSGRASKVVPVVENRPSLSSHLAEAHRSAQTVKTDEQPPSSRRKRIAYGPAHGGHVVTRPHIAADVDPEVERQAMREVLLESLDSFLSVHQSVKSDVIALAYRLQKMLGHH